MTSSIRIASLYSDLTARLNELRSDSGAVERSRLVVDRALERDEAIYGVNTGFGALASKRVSPDQLTKLQRNLLLSHACG
ncbi:MAG: aromatic amino acid lyase, partial [Wenzhouxiangella sp.]